MCMYFYSTELTDVTVLIREWFNTARDITARSEDPLKATKSDRTAAFFIWMVLAVGAQLLQQSNPAGVSSPEV
jgi:hypothetical protein